MQSCWWMCVCGWKRAYPTVSHCSEKISTEYSSYVWIRKELLHHSCESNRNEKFSLSWWCSRSVFTRFSCLGTYFANRRKSTTTTSTEKKPLVFIKKENPLHKKLHTSCEVEKEEARIRSEFGIYFGRVLLLLLPMPMPPPLPLKFTSFASLLWRVINVKKRFSYSCVVLLLFSCAFFFSLLLLTLYLHLK